MIYPTPTLQMGIHISLGMYKKIADKWPALDHVYGVIDLLCVGGGA